MAPGGAVESKLGSNPSHIEVTLTCPWWPIGMCSMFWMFSLRSWPLRCSPAGKNTGTG